MATINNYWDVTKRNSGHYIMSDSVGFVDDVKRTTNKEVSLVTK